MPDEVGYRAKFGVIIPSTNTVVEHDYNMIAPAGVTFHAGRMYVGRPGMESDREFEEVLAQIRGSLRTALRDCLTCKPDYMVMGMSAETFWGGIEGNSSFEYEVRDQSRLQVTTGATACQEALKLLGVRSIGVLSPYQPIADAQVTRFFEEAGFQVNRFEGLRCTSATAIAEVRQRTLRGLLRELDGPDTEAIVQVGTNLSMVRLADEAERWLDKPVVAINAITLWHALRRNGFPDQFEGFGSLLREH